MRVLIDFNDTKRFGEALYRGTLTVFVFFCPLIMWLFLITLRFDFASAINWIQTFIDFLIHRGGSGLDTGPKVSGVINRLMANDPTTTWGQISRESRLHFLFYIFIPLFVGTYGLFKPTKSFVERIIFLAVFGVFLGYTAWYFFWVPSMGMRYGQPALFSGLAVCIYFTMTRWKIDIAGWLNARHRSFVMVLSVVFLCVICFKSFQHLTPNIKLILRESSQACFP